MEKILIIEDEQLILESIAEYLQDEGYECLKASNGEDGIQIANHETPNLVVCDINMDGLNGYEVLRNLRTNPQTSTIPFIFLSALTDKRDLRKGMILGADDYITKPFQPEDLLKSVKTRLEKHLTVTKRMDNLRDSIALALPHELQTPLVTIMGYAEMLSEKFKGGHDDEALEFSDAIDTQDIHTISVKIRLFIFVALINIIFRFFIKQRKPKIISIFLKKIINHKNGN